MVHCDSHSPNFARCEGWQTKSIWHRVVSAKATQHSIFELQKPQKSVIISTYLPCFFHAWCTDGEVRITIVPCLLCVTADSCVRPWRDAADATSVAFRFFLCFSYAMPPLSVGRAYDICQNRTEKWIWIGCESKWQRKNWLTYSHLTYVRARALPLPLHCDSGISH